MEAQSVPRPYYWVHQVRQEAITREEGELKTAWGIGAISEVLLVAAIVCVGLALRNIVICLNSLCPYLLAPSAEHLLSLGLVLLVASATGFLFTLLSYRRVPTAKGRTEPALTTPK